MEEEMHSFRGVGARNDRKGNFSARVILMKYRTKLKPSAQAQFIKFFRLQSLFEMIFTFKVGYDELSLPIQDIIQDDRYKNTTLILHLPVFVVYDSIDERIVDGGGFCYDCRDSL